MTETPAQVHAAPDRAATEAAIAAHLIGRRARKRLPLIMDAVALHASYVASGLAEMETAAERAKADKLIDAAAKARDDAQAEAASLRQAIAEIAAQGDQRLAAVLAEHAKRDAAHDQTRSRLERERDRALAERDRLREQLAGQAVQRAERCPECHMPRCMHHDPGCSHPCEACQTPPASAVPAPGGCDHSQHAGGHRPATTRSGHCWCGAQGCSVCPDVAAYLKAEPAPGGDAEPATAEATPAPRKRSVARAGQGKARGAQAVTGAPGDADGGAA